MTAASREDGFTLVEVLVSMFIFSLISVGALIALSATLDARERATERIGEIERLSAARRLMADDVANLVRRQNRDGLGGFVDTRFQTVRRDRLELTRRGRPNPDGVFPRGDLLRVSWRVEGGQLVRSFLPHENPAYVEPPLDRIVLDGVEAMEVRVMAPRPESIQSLLDKVQTTVSRNGIADGFAYSITLTHADGTVTRHVFEIPNV
ncbi:MAG: type II secretion system minor pseudopilin GspJ [Litorimonas sp.]